MRYIFRADASREIGAGHVMRSSVLAEEAISRGHECIFVGQILDLAWLENRITKLGFSQIFRFESDFIFENNQDILILDSYTIPITSEFLGTGKWKFILSIADEITPEYHASAELRTSWNSRQNSDSLINVLEGPDYFLIRKSITKSSRKNLHETKSVLVTGGGSDPFGFVSAITKVIGVLGINVELHCFSENYIPNAGIKNLTVHPLGPELDILSNEIDLVLTTASTSSLEFIAKEIPMGIACAVDNQIANYTQLLELGYASQIGVFDPLGGWKFDTRELELFLTDTNKQDLLRSSIRGLVDLKGAARIIDYLEKN
jgi:spore coat polysaccharide biosynthesis predicted glycosyltransferase SpsG